jgi:hypothetical protein
MDMVSGIQDIDPDQCFTFCNFKQSGAANDLSFALARHLVASMDSWPHFLSIG